MPDDFLAKFIGNPARARIARLFALSGGGVFTLAQAAKRAGVGAQAAAREVRLLEKLGLLKQVKFSVRTRAGKKARAKGKQKEAMWTYDAASRRAGALLRFIHEVSPLEYKRIVGILRRSGRFSVVVLSGGFIGDSSRPVDLLVAADGVSEERLEAVVKKVEREFGREVRYAAFSTSEFSYRLTIEDRLVRDTLDYPHLVLLDRNRLL